VCSYYPQGAEDQLARHFAKGFTNQGIPTWSSTKAGLEYLQEKIQEGVHDALYGLVVEAMIQGIRRRNGHDFLIAVDLTKQTNELRSFYNKSTNKRLGAQQGPQPDPVDFLLRAYKAYCVVMDAKERTGSKEQGTIEETAAKYEGKRASTEKEGIDPRSFKEQMERYGYTWEGLLERFSYAREADRAPHTDS